MKQSVCRALSGPEGLSPEEMEIFHVSVRASGTPGIRKTSP